MEMMEMMEEALRVYNKEQRVEWEKETFSVGISAKSNDLTNEVKRYAISIGYDFINDSLIGSLEQLESLVSEVIRASRYIKRYELVCGLECTDRYTKINWLQYPSCTYSNSKITVNFAFSCVHAKTPTEEYK